MIETDRLSLRQPTLADIEAHFAIHGDPATNLHNPSGPLTDRAESADILRDWIAHWARTGFGYWAASLRGAPDAVIGFGGLARKIVAGVERLNLYFRFSPGVWGQGLATELARAALAGADGPVFALVRPDNAPSTAVLRKIGMEEIDRIEDVPGAAPSLLFVARPT